MNYLRKADLKRIVACAILFAAVQGMMFADIIGPFWELNIVLICINIILAVSLNLINGYTGQFSIGHAGFLAVGAYTGAIMTVKLGFPFEVALIVGTVAAGFLGFLIGLPTLRLNGDYLAIATLGLGEIIRICILNIDYVGGASGLMGIPRLTTFAWVFWIMIFIIFFIKNFKNSSYGRCCLAIRENEIAADTMGIDTTKYKVMAFTLGAAFAGTAGVLFAHYFYIAHPASFTFMRSFDILTMVVLGGLGSMTGSITGAILLTFISAYLAEYPEWRMIIYSVTMIVLMAKMEELLKVNDISMVFGGLRAVSNFSMTINKGELIGLIGPNGAGKTTAFNMITGVYTPTEGEIIFNGQRTSGKKSYQVTQLGMARTFQNIRLFSELSVIDNVKVAYNMHVKYGLLEAVGRFGRYFNEEEQITEMAMELLKIFHMEDKANELAKNLPYGEQRRLEIARALATGPKLLLLDEPAAGMNPQETKELMELIRWIREKFDLAILLIEHDMGLVMGVCERIYVLEYGLCIASGTPDEIKHNKRVIEAYLGEEVL